jgi:hypothetical protein
MKNLTRALVAIAVFLPAAAAAQPSFPTKPEDAQVISSDIGNFLEARSKFVPGGDNEAVLQRLYFDRASPGLKEFVQRFGLTAKLLNDAIAKDPGGYEDLDRFYRRIADFEAFYKEGLNNLKAVYPKAMFAPTYLLVGANRGIGQASREGQLVTVEKVTADLEKLRTLAIHETTHFQQAMSMGPQQYQALYAQKDNMLGWALREGAAEFVTYRLVGKNEEKFARLAHLNRNEIELWDRFRKDLKDQKKDFWLSVSFEDDNKGYPYLLGYAVGYKIVAAYYDKAADKKQALQDIIAITDPELFLEKSGYEPRLTKLQKEIRFGTPDPSAPAQLLDYRELIGISDCVSEQRALDGTWGKPLDMVWTFKYILGGTAVQDEADKEDGFYAGSIRQFNTDESSWYVHYYSNRGKPPAALPAWKGSREGNEMRLSSPQPAPNGAEGAYNIRFYEISEKGFKWEGNWTSRDGSVVFENWKIECRKRPL